MLAVSNRELATKPKVCAGDKLLLSDGEVVTLVGCKTHTKLDDNGARVEMGPSEMILFYSLNDKHYIAALDNRLIVDDAQVLEDEVKYECHYE